MQEWLDLSFQGHSMHCTSHKLLQQDSASCVCSCLGRMLGGQRCSRWPQKLSKGLIVKLTCTGEVPLSIIPFIKPA